MTTLNQEVIDAIDQSLEGVIDTVTSDSVVQLLNRQNLRPEQIDFDEHAIANAAHFAMAKLATPLRESAIAEIATQRFGLLRVSRPGDGTAVLLPRIETLAGDSTRVIGLRNLRTFTMASRATDAFGPVAIGVDTQAVADDATSSENKEAAAKGIREAICGSLKTWFEQTIQKIKDAIEKLGLKDALKNFGDVVKKLVTAGISALVGIGLSQWAAYLMLGLVVALVAAAIYYLVRYGLPAYCPAN